MKGQHLIILAILSSLFMIAGCGGQSTESTNTEVIPNSPMPDQGSAILARARTWIDNKVPYGSFDDNPDNDYYDGYRADCSGYVSYAWALPKPGPNTSTIGNYASQVEISDLQPGDALNNGQGGKEGHIVIFVKWIDREKYTFDAYDENINPGFASEKKYTLLKLGSSDWTIQELDAYAKGPYKAERLNPLTSSVLSSNQSEGPISSTITAGQVPEIETQSPNSNPAHLPSVDYSSYVEYDPALPCAEVGPPEDRQDYEELQSTAQAGRTQFWVEEGQVWRETPSFGGRIVYTVTGDLLTNLLDGPNCSDSSGRIFWYKVNANGAEGWVASYDPAYDWPP